MTWETLHSCPSRPRQNGQHFADEIFKYNSEAMFSNWHYISIAWFNHYSGAEYPNQWWAYRHTCMFHSVSVSSHIEAEATWLPFFGRLFQSDFLRTRGVSLRFWVPGSTLVPNSWSNSLIIGIPCFHCTYKMIYIYIYIPCSVLILASDWLTTVRYGAVSHVWRHQREI